MRWDGDWMGKGGTIDAAEDRLATDRAAVETTGLIADLNIVDGEMR